LAGRRENGKMLIIIAIVVIVMVYAFENPESTEILDPMVDVLGDIIDFLGLQDLTLGRV